MFAKTLKKVTSGSGRILVILWLGNTTILI
jgi:hypothetical protein